MYVYKKYKQVLQCPRMFFEVVEGLLLYQNVLNEQPNKSNEDWNDKEIIIKIVITNYNIWIYCK